MRPFVFAAAPLLIASATFAHSPLRRGQTTDTCAILDADLVFPDVDSKPYNAGHIDIGLCVSQVEKVIDHYGVTAAAVKVVGVAAVEAALTDMIKKAGVQCSYPPHAKPSVSSRNECSFICVDGFTAMPPNYPSSCVCPSNMTECDGKCGDPQLDCSTKAPASRRQNDPKCAETLTMCGVPGTASGQAYKCIDVTSDSYACGGCVKPSPFGSPLANGVDCHDIPNVDNVVCEDSKCAVRSCKTGFKPSVSKNACVAIHGHVARAIHARGVDHVLGLNLVEGEKNMVARGSVDRVPGADAALDATRQTLSAAKADGRVVP